MRPPGPFARGPDGDRGGPGDTAVYEPRAGQGPAVGPPSDIFSLGLLLYTILTGKLAFEGTCREAVTRSRRREMLRSCPRTHRDPSLPRALEAICLKALSARPRTATPRRVCWPTTSSTGWPTSRSRPPQPWPVQGSAVGEAAPDGGGRDGCGLCGRAAVGRDLALLLSAAGESGDHRGRSGPGLGRSGPGRGASGLVLNASTRRHGSGPRAGEPQPPQLSTAADCRKG